jgi:hypothetical protein
MNEDQSHVEANVARLIQAAMGGGAQLEHDTRKRIWGRLSAEVRCLPALHRFPEWALTLLGGVQVCAAWWFGSRVARGGIREAIGTLDLLLSLPVLFNLALVPIAAMVILQRRRRHDWSA